MFAEAAQAPKAVRRQLHENAARLARLAARLRQAPPRAIVTCARGSSDHAATFARYLIETRLGLLTSSAAPSVSSVYAAAPDLSGAVMLAISTDMQTPKDIDVVSIFVSTGGVTKFDYLGRVLPDGTLSLPSTLALVQPDDPSSQVHIRGIGFRTADQIAAKLGIEKTALIRVRAGISYALADAMDEGHCGLPAEEITALTAKLLEVSAELISTVTDSVMEDAAGVAESATGEDVSGRIL